MRKVAKISHRYSDANFSISYNQFLFAVARWMAEIEVELAVRLSDAPSFGRTAEKNGRRQGGSDFLRQMEGTEIT